MRYLVQPSPDFERFRVLARDGTLDEDTKASSSDLGNLQKLHEGMLRARRFDERRLKLQRQGALGTFAPVKGQEAAQVGAVACLEEDDWLVPAFRETAAILWRGTSMEDLLVVSAGWNEGIAMPQEGRNLPDTVPVASQLPIAVGIAHAGRVRGDKSVVMTFFGDGATSEGDFQEAMNFAAVMSAPVVFVCQNNGWAISTDLEDQTASTTLAQKAHAYGMDAAQVDGNDVLAARAVVEEAVNRARKDGLPAMIEAVTYRMEVHTTADDPTRYREDEEVEEWRDLDPIERAQKLLESPSQLDDAMLEALEVQIEEEIETAWNAAKDRIADLEKAPTDVIFDHIFADPTEPLRRLEILVPEGDTVSEGQDLMTVESDKAAIELPSPYEGTISKVRVKEGDTAVVGDVLVVFEDEGGEQKADSAPEDGDAGNSDGDREDAAETERANRGSESDPAEGEEPVDGPREDESGKNEDETPAEGRHDDASGETEADAESDGNREPGRAEGARQEAAQVRHRRRHLHHHQCRQPGQAQPVAVHQHAADRHPRAWPRAPKRCHWAISARAPARSRRG